MCSQSLSRVQLSVAPWTVALQASQSMEFSRQEYWNELPFPTPGDPPSPGVGHVSPESSALTGGFFTTHGSHHVTAEQMLSQVSQQHLAHFFMRTSYWIWGPEICCRFSAFENNLNFTCSNIFQSALSTTSPCTENVPWKGQPNPKPLKNNSFSIRISSSDNKQKQ